jgi:hypothetical protein
MLIRTGLALDQAKASCAARIYGVENPFTSCLLERLELRGLTPTPDLAAVMAGLPPPGTVKEEVVDGDEKWSSPTRDTDAALKPGRDSHEESVASSAEVPRLQPRNIAAPASLQDSLDKSDAADDMDSVQSEMVIVGSSPFPTTSVLPAWPGGPRSTASLTTTHKSAGSALTPFPASPTLNDWDRDSDTASPTALSRLAAPQPPSHGSSFRFQSLPHPDDMQVEEDDDLARRRSQRQKGSKRTHDGGDDDEEYLPHEEEEEQEITWGGSSQTSRRKSGRRSRRHAPDYELDWE